MVGLAILSALLALGIPAYTTYLQNARLSANANTFLGMLRSARAEAIKTNRPVDIILTDQGVGNYDLVAAASTVSGRNFIVRSNLTAGPKLVDSRSAQEGAAQLVGIRGSVPSITFTGLGTTTLGAVGRINFTSPDPNNCAAKNGIARCQRVCVYPSGRALVCDTAAVPMDTRACPAECQE
jgi:type IV fimbrial biogenesis protein FimT